MKTNEQYQEFVRNKIVTGGARDEFELTTLLILGLCGESGEVAEKWKKIMRDHENELTHENILALLYELGDVLFYVVAVAEKLNSNLNELIEFNVNKLDSRAERGVIQGDGDDR